MPNSRDTHLLLTTLLCVACGPTSLAEGPDAGHADAQVDTGTIGDATTAQDTSGGHDALIGDLGGPDGVGSDAASDDGQVDGGQGDDASAGDAFGDTTGGDSGGNTGDDTAGDDTSGDGGGAPDGGGSSSGGQDGGGASSGGQDSSGSSSGGQDGGGASSGGQDGGGDAGADAGGGTDGTCVVDADCPSPGAACFVAVCNPQAHRCELGFAAGSCDDGDPCTADEVCQGGTCTAATFVCGCASDADCASKSNNACAGPLKCDVATSKCVIKPGGVTVCPSDGNPCTIAVCDKQSGACSSAPADGLACDDANPCTTGDVCAKGACKGATGVCPCTNNAECAGFALDKCTTKVLCDALSGNCTPVPTGKKSCPDDGNPCTLTACDAVTGACLNSPLVAACDDGDPCTVGDFCHNSVCTAGKPGCGCQVTADCKLLDGADKCAARHTCQVGVCAVDPTSAVACPPHPTPACALNACVPTTGVCAPKPHNEGDACDDGNACTKPDICKLGACLGDTSGCGCKATADCAAHDDGNVCNGTLFCAGDGSCRVDPASLVACPAPSGDAAKSACTAAACDTNTGKCSTAAAPDGTSCPSGKPCEASACVAGQCKLAKPCGCQSHADCALLANDKCQPGYCDTSAAPWSCKAVPGARKICAGDGLNACQAPSCDAQTGKCTIAALDSDTACEDGNWCTVGDACGGGKCVPGKGTCKCAKTSDCAGTEDGNACNGTLYCDRWLGGVCRVDPATVTRCDPDKDTACQVSTCNKTNGACTLVNRADGTKCDDNTPCTAADACKAGVCTGANTCKCTEHSDCAKANPANLCDGTFYCDRSAAPWSCKKNPATGIACKQGNNPACQTNACNPKTGKCGFVAAADGAACEDGDACTVNTCKTGKCATTKQVCACKTHADCAKVDDGNPCNGTLYCDKTSAPHTCKKDAKGPIQCDPKTDSACLAAACDPKDGACKQQPKKDGAACNDGDKCTAADVCKAGKCAAGASVCTCNTNADCAGADDGNACNGAGWCDPTTRKCKANNPATAVFCPVDLASKPCTTLGCNPKNGKCEALPKVGPVPCDDGNPCTSGQDFCSGATCGSGANNACACTTDAQCAASDDGLPCNGTLTCQAGKCAVNPATVVDCQGSDDYTCTRQICNGKSGKCDAVNTENKKCDDGDACTTNDFCAKGRCEGQVYLCFCAVAADCAKSWGSVCKGAPYCDRSTAGKHECKADPSSVVLCDASLDTTCSVNKCDSQLGTCATVQQNAAKVCDDNDPCTSSETCFDGVCGAPDPVKQKQLKDDANPNNDNDPTGGQGTHVCVCETDADCKTKDDGDLCNGTKWCDMATHTCLDDAATTVICDDTGDTQCLLNMCWPELGQCKQTPAENIKKIIFLPQKPGDPQIIKYVPTATRQVKFQPCDDGDLCTVNDECDKGQCNKGNTLLCACQNDADCAQKGDGNPCAGVSFCDTTKAYSECKVDPATVPYCSGADDTDCAVHVCDKNTGFCEPTALGQKFTPCNDGNECTVGDLCEGTVCKPGTDVCACVKDADCKGSGQDLPCAPAYCDRSKPTYACAPNPAAKVWCDPVNASACVGWSCAAATGVCTAQPKSFNACDDGDPCTPVSHCSNGSCFGNSTCQCQADADCAKFGIAPCLGGYYCDRSGTGTCRPDPRDKPLCKGPLGDCKIDACDAKTGACAVRDQTAGTPCDDGKPCTLTAFCGAKGCESGPNACMCDADGDCKGGDFCHPMYCDKSTPVRQCKAVPVAGGVCPNPPLVSCLVATCDTPTKACATAPAPDGTACGVGKTCNQGKCG